VNITTTTTTCLTALYPGQCCIKGVLGARGAAAPGPAVLGARNWWEWKIFMCCYTSVRGLYLAQHPAPH